jgi:hypothetical protein
MTVQAYITTLAPNDFIPLGFDFVNWLANANTTIASTTVTENTNSISISNVTFNNTQVQFFVSGGVSGNNYIINCAIQTSSVPSIIKHAEAYLSVS